eukprot:GFYU01005717.1.p1 GENE.GFYU01005717.1~~GFYU01005717.1.p1  ORF type:complete len:469 (+),score=132.08 GFYU01005717.1:90-1496(+)
MAKTVTLFAALASSMIGAVTAVPSQVHIALAGDSMSISWETKANSDSIVNYSTDKSSLSNSAMGTSQTYTYGSYTSGYQHHVKLDPLDAATVYYYQCGDDKDGWSPVYSFETPPAVGLDVPYTFAVMGDLGQTENSRATVEHVLDNPAAKTVLLAGDLSYADGDQPRWDSWGEMVEPLFSERPLMATAGNHEVEVLDGKKFIAYQARFRMPAEESGATEGNLYHSFNCASAHVIFLCSYTDYGHDSAQYKWLKKDLAAVNRKQTPWIFVLFHAPWYNSNTAHHDETEEWQMRESMEDILNEYGVDAVFSGHVHAYERNHRVYNKKVNETAPVYMTVGDGGNREGLASKWYNQPVYSAFREASYGYGALQILNHTHTKWQWHRDQDGDMKVSDTYWIVNYQERARARALRAYQESRDFALWVGAGVCASVGVVVAALFVSRFYIRKKRSSMHDDVYTSITAELIGEHEA